jgi:hypothetical protein
MRRLHQLIKGIPAARLFLAHRAAQSAPTDDEPVTEGDAAAIAQTRDEVPQGKVVSHDDLLREFGLRCKHLWRCPRCGQIWEDSSGDGVTPWKRWLRI